MLTAIVVGFATMSVGLALIYQIHREYNTILESEITQSPPSLRGAKRRGNPENTVWIATSATPPRNDGRTNNYRN